VYTRIFWRAVIIIIIIKVSVSKTRGYEEESYTEKEIKKKRAVKNITLNGYTHAATMMMIIICVFVYYIPYNITQSII